jgi:hypothetical protein
MTIAEVMDLALEAPTDPARGTARRLDDLEAQLACLRDSLEAERDRRPAAGRCAAATERTATALRSRELDYLQRYVPGGVPALR